MGDDPIAVSLRRSLDRAVARLRPKARPAHHRSGLAAPTIRIGSDRRSINASPLTQVIRLKPSGYAQTSPVPETRVVIRLPESDRAKKLSREERRDKKDRRKAKRKAQRKNRRGKKR